MISFKKILLLSGSLILSAVSLQAQVATPYLNPAMGNDAGTATMWRMHSVVSARLEQIDGEQTSAGIKVAELESNGTEFLGAYAGESVALEVAVSNSKFETQLVPPIGTTKSETTFTGTSAFFSWRGSDSFGLALEYGSVSSETDPSNAKSENSSLGLGVGLRLGEPVFLSFGQREITSTGNDGTKDFEENSWSETYYGVAFLAGNPKSNLFKAEYSKTWSAEARKDANASATTADNHHQKNEETNIVLEARLSSFGLLYEINEDKDYALSWTTADDEETTTKKYGIAWTNETVVVGVAKVESEYESGTSERKLDGYVVNVGYLF